MDQNQTSDIKTEIVSEAEQREQRELQRIEQEVEKEYYITEKFRRWIQCFFDRTNKQTFLNQTQSAIVAYNLDPEKQYFTAGKIGSVNAKKVKSLSKIAYDKMGVNHGTYLAAIWTKAQKQQSNDLLQWIGEALDITNEHPLPISAQYQQTINNFNLNAGTDINKLDDNGLDALIQRRIETLQGGAFNLTSGEGEKI